MADEQPSHFDVVIANLEKRIYVYGGHWQSVDIYGFGIEGIDEE